MKVSTFVAADNMCLHSEQCLFVIVLFWGIFKITVTPRYKCYVDIIERVKKAHVFSLSQSLTGTGRLGSSPGK